MAIAQERERLAHLSDMEVEVTVELGRTKMSLADAGRLRVGNVVEMDRLAGQAFDVLINDTLFGRGEIVVVNENMACRLTQVEEPVEAREESLI